MVVIKPDGTVRRRVGALTIERIIGMGYQVSAFKEMHVSESLARAHYSVHLGKPFFSWLVRFMTCARVVAMIIDGPDVIQGIRALLGATFVQKADPESIRGRYGLIGGINIAHASDGPETARQEIELWTKHGGLKRSRNAGTEALSYISRYAHGEVDLTMQIRGLLQSTILNGHVGESVQTELESLLRQEACDITDEEVMKLSEIILDLVREECEKAKSHA